MISHLGELAVKIRPVFPKRQEQSVRQGGLSRLTRSEDENRSLFEEPLANSAFQMTPKNNHISGIIANCRFFSNLPRALFFRGLGEAWRVARCASGGVKIVSGNLDSSALSVFFVVSQSISCRLSGRFFPSQCP